MPEFNIALIGCGSFAREVHIPSLRAIAGLHIRAVVDVDEESARETAGQVGADYWTQDAGRVFADPEVTVVLIATPHNHHAPLSIRAAQAGKHIFCEKPMGLSVDECERVARAVRASGVKYSAGYNRSMAPLTAQVRQKLGALEGPMMVHHRIADWFPYSRGWLLDEALSGGRIVGEAGHALDMICQMVNQDPLRVYAEGGNLVQNAPGGAADSAIITLGFPDGSAGSLFLSSISNNGLPKEEILICRANHTFRIDGFERLEIYSPQGKESFALPKMDKGQAALLKAFATSVLEDRPAPAGVETAMRASLCTFAALKSLQTNEVQWLT